MNIKNIIIGKVQTPKNGSGDIWDEKDNHIADACGWGRFQYQENGEKKLDYLASFIVDAINEKISNKDEVIPSLKNKLSPFWNLVELLLVDDNELPEDSDAYSLLIQKEAIKCRDNREKIISLLNSLNS